ncbi:arrestin domain-containing protein 4-like [Megalops cyprinoides]|uniref:arrestin domain-containing protein 4-like n=1 Tax=Megalops cyprinoides TaxID=118141 RepID=UPI00186411F6|nr:arrestin domain-containing protein 4-like [Megalops cyprinoides]
MVDRITTLGIVFDDEQKNGYCSGEVLSGYVLLEVSAVTQIKAINVSAGGSAHVSWNERPRGATSPISVSIATPSLSRGVKEEVEYFAASQAVLEATDGGVGQCLSLSVGRHEFAFRFELPHRPLVSSFTGKYGRVQYWVKAEVRRPSAPDQSVCREFPVISHIDLNSPSLLCPVSTNKEKMIGCWIFTSGPISLSVNIERKGYCNGEEIPIFAEIENCSSRLVVPKAAIYQTQTCLAKGKTKTYRQAVASVRGNHIPSGCSDRWNGKTLKVPPLSPSILNSALVRVEYSLAVTVQIPGAKKLSTELPIVIGTIPCAGLGAHGRSGSGHFSQDVSWLTLALPEQPEAPPNYADVVSEEEFEQHTPSAVQSDELERQLGGPIFAYIQEFRFQPPPVYSEVDPYPV